MPIEDPNDLDRVDQEIRINELKQQAEEVGGPMTTWEAEDCPPGLAESFWQSVVNYEKAPLTCHFQQLLDAGVELPEHEKLSDAELSTKLWEVIQRLAQMRVFISRTNHLSDRELYVRLWTDCLREENPAMPVSKYSAWHIDMLGECSEEDIQLSMKYYADDDERARWLKSFPNYIMPPHEDPPFDRDRQLPQSGM